MTPLSIRFHPDRDDLIFPDIEEGQGLQGELVEIVAVANGVDGAGGVTRPSVLLRIELPDGKVAIAMTTARLFCTAGRAITAKYPDLFDGD